MPPHTKILSSHSREEMEKMPGWLQTYLGQAQAGGTADGLFVHLTQLGTTDKLLMPANPPAEPLPAVYVAVLHEGRYPSL